MRRRRFLQLTLLFFLVCWLPISCTYPTQPAKEQKTPTALVAELATEPVPAGVVPTAQPTMAPHLPPTPLGDPLRFVFPSSEPAPVSAWRPPLYPTPWAPTPYDHFYFGRPIGANEVNWPLPDYRFGGVFFKNEVHTGVDIDAPTGTPVMAAGPGKVIWAGYGLLNQTYNLKDPYGIAVAIKHDFGYQGQTLVTYYGHMSKLLVTRGQHVEGGEVLGLVGDTGHTTGPHLHFEVRVGTDNFYRTHNPELWMAPPQGWSILAARIMDANGGLLEKATIKIHSLEKNRYWEVKTYGPAGYNLVEDPYYHENMVIGDLPAGDYEVLVPSGDKIVAHNVTLRPGMVTFFSYRTKIGFDDNPPPTPTVDFP